MAKTMADLLMEEGEQKGERKGELRARQQTLLRQLGRRFGELPPRVVEVIESTEDIEQLDKWLERILAAATFAEMEIGAGASEGEDDR
ncbi:MAG TPA: DUF4351 domain-containing protein [Planctomycetaceae bacterium]|nr:DUF4351 domain-containing protein [Planctomycetaceae bacterium]